MTTPEGKIKNRVKKILKEHGAYYFMPVQTGYGAPAHDFIVCHNGRFLSIETKASADKKMTLRQANLAEEIGNAGGMFLLIYDDPSLNALEFWLRIVGASPPRQKEARNAGST